MANHKSAKKRIRQTIVVTERNRQKRSKVRSAFKAVLEAVTKKDKKLANEAFISAESTIMSAVSKGVYKKETASRKVSRTSKLLKKTFA